VERELAAQKDEAESMGGTKSEFENLKEVMKDPELRVGNNNVINASHSSLSHRTFCNMIKKENRIYAVLL
jgi:hypothetical protein